MSSNQKQERTKPRVIVGVPPERFGAADEQIMFDLIAIAQQGWPFIRLEYQPTDAARQLMAEHLMRSEFTHLLMLDADHRHPADIVQRLMRWVIDDPERLVVAGYNFRRGGDHDPLAWVFDENGKLAAIQRAGGLVKLNIGYGGTCATCAMLISRKVFERLEPPWFYYPRPKRLIGSTAWPAEDTRFCERLNEAQIDIWIDTTTTSPHLGERWADGTDCKVPERFQSTVPLQLRVLRDDRDWMWRVPELATTAGRVLYIGARPDRAEHAVKLYDMGHELTLLEAFRPNVAYFRGEPGPFAYVVEGDVRNVDNLKLPHDTYEYAFWWHGPEHVRPTELPQVLKRLEALATHVVLGCPWGHYEQDAIYGNEFEKHLADVRPADLPGYTILTEGEPDTPRGQIIAWR